MSSIKNQMGRLAHQIENQRAKAADIRISIDRCVSSLMKGEGITDEVVSDLLWSHQALEDLLFGLIDTARQSARLQEKVTAYVARMRNRPIAVLPATMLERGQEITGRDETVYTVHDVWERAVRLRFHKEGDEFENSTIFSHPQFIQEFGFDWEVAKNED